MLHDERADLRLNVLGLALNGHLHSDDLSATHGRQQALVRPGRSTSVRFGTCGERIFSPMGVSEMFCLALSQMHALHRACLAVADDPVRLALNLQADLVEVGEGLRSVSTGRTDTK